MTYHDCACWTKPNVQDLAPIVGESHLLVDSNMTGLLALSWPKRPPINVQVQIRYRLPGFDLLIINADRQFPSSTASLLGGKSQMRATQRFAPDKHSLERFSAIYISSTVTDQLIIWSGIGCAVAEPKEALHVCRHVPIALEDRTLARPD